MLWGSIPYQHFIDNQAPNWNEIWSKQNTEDIFAFFVAYNGQRIDKQRYQPNVAKLKAQFTTVLLEQLFDYQKQLAFGVFYIRETQSNLDRLLAIEFDDYFKPTVTP